MIQVSVQNKTKFYTIEVMKYLLPVYKYSAKLQHHSFLQYMMMEFGMIDTDSDDAQQVTFN